MFKKVFTLILVISLLFSCDFLERQFKQKTVEEVETVVDFNSVDAFPLFPDCSEIPSREKQQVCFQLEMSKYIYASLKENSFSSNEKISDTVFVKLKIDSSGNTTVSQIITSNSTKELFPRLDSLITQSVSNLPLIQPAIKRNIPVTTEFTLPIILQN